MSHDDGLIVVKSSHIIAFATALVYTIHYYVTASFNYIHITQALHLYTQQTTYLPTLLQHLTVAQTGPADPPPRD